MPLFDLAHLGRFKDRRGGEAMGGGSHKRDYTIVPPGAGLGLSPQTIAAAISGNPADVEGAEMKTADMFMQPGAPGLGSGEYYSAINAIRNANVAAGGARLRDTLRDDEMIRRSDFDRRARLLSSFLSSMIGARQAWGAGNARTMGSSHGMNMSASAGMTGAGGAGPRGGPAEEDYLNTNWSPF